MSKIEELTKWATPILATLLPLPEEDLEQVVSYAATSSDLSTPNAIASHFTDLLGNSSDVFNFVEEFNKRRFPASASSSKQNGDSSGVPKSQKKKATQKAPLNKLPALRRPNEGYASSADEMFEKKQNVYRKKDEDDYMSLAPPKKAISGSTSLTPNSSAPASRESSRASTPNPLKQKQAGTLTSDLITTKKKKAASHQPTIHLTGGTSMRAPSEDVSDLTAALRTLEMTTNPTLPSSSTSEKSLKQRFCGCNATKHDLLLAAPNCLACGKVICIKEGLGPCTFCGAQLISSEDMEQMRSFLRMERGKEKMESDNSSHRKADVSRGTNTAYGFTKSSGINTPVSGTNTPPSSAALTSALMHRDKLINFQNTSAQRTHIIDQAADFETPEFGQNIWATPQERALQLRAQQKKMREIDWANKDAWEKRQVVVAIDLSGKKVVREMRDKAPPTFDEPESDPEPEVQPVPSNSGQGNSTGLFSKNPLMKGYIRPVWNKENNTQESSNTTVSALRSGWRRVQDDKVDNEEYILDGMELGDQGEEKATEPAFDIRDGDVG